MIRSLLISVAVALCFPLSLTAVAVEHSQHHAGHHDMPHESGMLMVETKPTSPIAGQPVVLHMMIHQADGAMVREFELTHEKLLHLIIVLDGLDEFAHVHPEVDKKGNLTLSHTFQKAGTYRLFADYKAKGQPAAVALATVEVAGKKSAAAKLVVNAPGDVTADGVATQIGLENAKAEQESTLRFQLRTEAGKPIGNIQPHPGPRGHLVGNSAHRTKDVHAHPTDGKTPAHEVVFLSHFPVAGVYKGWAQFRIAGKVRTVPFVVRIP